MAFRAISVATAVVCDERMPADAVLTTRNMPAELCCSAALDGTHHLQLIKAHMAAIGITPSGTMLVKDVRDLES